MNKLKIVQSIPGPGEPYFVRDDDAHPIEYFKTQQLAIDYCNGLGRDYEIHDLPSDFVVEANPNSHKDYTILSTGMNPPERI